MNVDKRPIGEYLEAWFDGNCIHVRLAGTNVDDRSSHYYMSIDTFNNFMKVAEEGWEIKKKWILNN